MLAGQPLEQSVAWRISSLSSGGGLSRSSATISLTRSFIFDQSSTASRTSRSTRWTSATIASGSSPSRSRSISTCIHDSRTTPSSGRVAPSGTGARGLERAGDVALDVELRVDHEVDVAQLATELHRERVDEERHVVDDDLDHRVPAGRPAVLAGRRRHDADLGGALGPVTGELVVAGERAVHVGVGPVEQVLGGDVAVVRAQQVVDLVVRWAAGALPVLGEVDRLRQELALVRLVRRR